MSDAPSTDVVPEGFAPHFRRSPLTDAWEPLYSCRDGARFLLGLWIRDQHCNARGLAHGGLISALADNAMGLACVLARAGGAGSALTASMTVNFIGTARSGQWLEIAAEPVRSGRSIGFASAEIAADGVVVARASAVFRMLAAKEERS